MYVKSGYNYLKGIHSVTKINDFAVLFSHEENYHNGLIEKFIVTPHNVIKAVVTVLNGHSNLAPHIKKYRNPISK